MIKKTSSIFILFMLIIVNSNIIFGDDSDDELTNDDSNLVKFLSDDNNFELKEEINQIEVTIDGKKITYKTKEELNDAVDKKVYELNKYLIKSDSDEGNNELTITDNGELKVGDKEYNSIQELEEEYLDELKLKDQIEYEIYKDGQEETFENTLDKIKNQDEENSEELKTAFQESVDEGSFDEISPDRAGQLMYEMDLDSDTMRTIATAVNGRDCNGFFGSMMCSIVGQKDAGNLREQALINDMKNVQNDFLTSSENGITVGAKSGFLGFGENKKGETICEDGVNWDECKREAEHEELCGEGTKDEDCSKIYDKFRSSSSISPEDLEEHNTKQIEKFLDNREGLNNNDNIKEQCREGYTDECKTAIDESDICNDNPDSSECKRFKNDMNTVINQGLVESNMIHSIVSALKNPDQGGMKAAEYFGFKANYENLPPWLSQDLETSICAKKINGYLDKNVENDGGVTRYECLDSNLSANPSDLCLNVQADIRGHRTKMTPDNKTLITFSYYLRAPENQNINFVVAVAYKSNNVVKKELLVKKTSIKKGGYNNGFDSVELPIEDADGLDPDSFIVAIGGFYKDNTPYLELKAPVVMATTDTYFVDAPRDKSNAQAKKTKDTPVDLLELMNI